MLGLHFGVEFANDNNNNDNGCNRKNFKRPASWLMGRELLAGLKWIAAHAFRAAHLGDPIAVNCWRLLAAFVLGAIFSCIWFGWYLAVSLAFHGHTNEAGGGARSEQYRHMIRFKLTEDTLTSYVIGIDAPVTSFAMNALPKFRLVDVFTIQTQKLK